MKTKLVHIATFSDTISAHLLRTKLESEGIPCFLNNEHITNLLPHYFNIIGSGVQVLVPADKIEEAQDIAQLRGEKLTCPNCKSSEIVNTIENKLPLKIFLIVLSLIGVVPFGNITNRYTCGNCRHSFSQNIID